MQEASPLEVGAASRIPDFLTAIHFRIKGLDPSPFNRLFDSSDVALARNHVTRLTVTRNSGFACAITLDPVVLGETVLLIDHARPELSYPACLSNAFVIKQTAIRAADYVDAIPAVFDLRTISLRGFNPVGLLVAAMLAEPGCAAAALAQLLGNFRISHIHVHDAAHGLFIARIDRSPQAAP